MCKSLKKGIKKVSKENVFLKMTSLILLTPMQKQEKPISHHAWADKQSAIMVFNNIVF